MEVMKQLRQRSIRDLVEQRPIRTQQELATALRERGFRTTQATISRDIAELQLVKARRDGVSVYARSSRLADADPALAITDNYEGTEIEPLAALHHLGNTIKRDQFVLQAVAVFCISLISLCQSKPPLSVSC